MELNFEYIIRYRKIRLKHNKQGSIHRINDSRNWVISIGGHSRIRIQDEDFVFFKIIYCNYVIDNCYPFLCTLSSSIKKKNNDVVLCLILHIHPIYRSNENDLNIFEVCFQINPEYIIRSLPMSAVLRVSEAEN